MMEILKDYYLEVQWDILMVKSLDMIKVSKWDIMMVKRLVIYLEM